MSKLLPLSVAVAVAAVLAGCASTPPEEDPVQIKLNDLDARVARIERVVSNQSLVQLAQNLDSVQQETRRLRGRIDELENSNEQMKKQLAASASVRIIGGGANANNGAYGAAGAAGRFGRRRRRHRQRCDQWSCRRRFIRTPWCGWLRWRRHCELGLPQRPRGRVLAPQTCLQAVPEHRQSSSPCTRRPFRR